MTGGKDQRESWPGFTVLLLLAILIFPGCLEASPKSCPELMLFGGSFERPPVHRFLPSSRRTLLFPASVDETGFVHPLSETFWGNSRRWDRLVDDSLERASLLLSTTEPLLVRDSKGVLQMAVLSSESPLLATGILTKGFLNRFSALFGPELLVAVPARNKVYVFPKLCNRLPEASAAVRDDHIISPCPVSTEIFEVSRKGLKAVGTVEPDER